MISELQAKICLQSLKERLDSTMMSNWVLALNGLNRPGSLACCLLMCTELVREKEEQAGRRGAREPASHLPLPAPAHTCTYLHVLTYFLSLHFSLFILPANPVPYSLLLFLLSSFNFWMSFNLCSPFLSLLLSSFSSFFLLLAGIILPPMMPPSIALPLLPWPTQELMRALSHSFFYTAFLLYLFYV